MGDVEAAFSVCDTLLGDRSAEVREAVAALLQEALAAEAEATREFLDRRRGRIPRGLLRAILS
jgi:hypothetical protein